MHPSAEGTEQTALRRQIRRQIRRGSHQPACAESNGAECTPQELRGQNLRPPLGPRSSSFERLTRSG
eukprot:719418-Alexandrium_andersonii.AAC.1